MGQLLSVSTTAVLCAHILCVGPVVLFIGKRENGDEEKAVRFSKTGVSISRHRKLESSQDKVLALLGPGPSFQGESMPYEAVAGN